MKIIDVQSRFFIPLWRRVAVVVVCGLWTLVELAQNQMFWAGLAGVIGLYCAHQFFIAFNPPDSEDSEG